MHSPLRDWENALLSVGVRGLTEPSFPSAECIDHDGVSHNDGDTFVYGTSSATFDCECKNGEATCKKRDCKCLGEGLASLGFTSLIT